MGQKTKAKLAATDKKQIRAEIREMIAEMQRINERIRKIQAETERLRTKTRATLDEIAERLKTRPFSHHS